MDEIIAQRLCQINNDFYATHWASFAATRRNSQLGWKTCLAALRADGLLDGRSLPGGSLAVFDLACGSLRFEDWLAEQLHDVALQLYCVDNCAELLPENPSPPNLRFFNLDVCKLLLAGESLSDHLDIPACRLSVSFGFLHHLPLQRMRLAAIEGLIAQTRPGGYVAVSLWQFMSDAGLAEQAESSHAQALAKLGLPSLGENDYLLGWQGLDDAWRYCHNFTDSEVDGLVEAVGGASLLSRFKSDGRTGSLNHYLVFKV